MRLIATAIIAAGLCIASAIADAAPADSSTRSIDQAFWSYSAGGALGIFLLMMIAGSGRPRPPAVDHDPHDPGQRQR